MSSLISHNQTRSWQQLSNNEKEIVIDIIRDNPTVSSHRIVHNNIEAMIELSIEDEIQNIKNELSDVYGIEAEIFYEFGHRRNGACFEATDNIDVWKLLSKLNYKNLFSNKDEDFNNVLKLYVDKISIYMYRVNHHEDYEYSMAFGIENYNQYLKDELIDVFSEEEIEKNTDAVKNYSMHLEKIIEAFCNNDLYDFLMVWEKNYCIKMRNMLQKIYSVSEQKIYEMYSNILSTNYWGYDIERNSVVSKEFKFLNENNRIEVIQHTNAKREEV